MSQHPFNDLFVIEEEEEELPFIKEFNVPSLRDIRGIKEQRAREEEDRKFQENIVHHDKAEYEPDLDTLTI
jgi:hypothetical protein